MPNQYPPLLLSSTNIGSIFRQDFEFSHLFAFWSIYLMSGQVALERWTSQAIYEADIMDLPNTAGTSLAYAASVYPIFQDYYRELVKACEFV